MNEKIHPKILASVLNHPAVLDALDNKQTNRAVVSRLISDQLYFLERRCDYISTDPCASFPSCLCGQQIFRNMLIDLKVNIDYQILHRTAHPNSDKPPPNSDKPAPNTTPPKPPRKRPAVAVSVPRKFEFTDARGSAWKRSRKVKGSDV